VLGLPMVVSPGGRHAVTVATGTEQTGRVGLSPTTRYGKGPAFPVGRGRQLSLLGDAPDAHIPQDMWVLLMSRSATVIRCELSQPTHRNPDRTIGFTAQRILLPEIAFEHVVEVNEERDEYIGLELDVPVERL
jgi:hypothetical protein